MKVGARGLEKELGPNGEEIKEGGGGNREEEIVGSHAISIANAVNYTTGTAPTGPKEVRHVIGGNVTKILSGTDTKQVNGGNSFLQVNAGDMVRSVVGNLIMSTTNPGIGPLGNQQGQVTIAAANKMNLKSATSMNLQTDFDGLNINVSGVELTDNDLALTTATGSIFNLTVAGAANWNNTGKVTETFLASQKTNITGDLDLDTSTAIDIDSGTTIDATAGTIFTIESGGGSPSATNKVDINP